MTLFTQNDFPFIPGTGTYKVQVGTINLTAGQTQTITFANGFSFAAATSYGIFVSTDAAAQQTIVPYAQTATTFKLTNPDGMNAHNFQWVAIGT